MRRLLSLHLMLALALLVVPPPAQAQGADDTSAAAIARRLQGQRTRGLVVAPPVEDGASGGTVAPDAYVEMDQDLQVNVQIRFDFDSAVLKPAEAQKLVAVCEAMRTVDIDHFLVIGHTDAVGSAAYNRKLSLLRADEVKRYLVRNCDIDASRLRTMGVGEDHLADPANPDAGVNRRVEFQVTT